MSTTAIPRRSDRMWSMEPEGGASGEVGTVARVSETRTEHDSMGEVEVPRDALWRAQTQRAVENFPISGTDRSSPVTSRRSRTSRPPPRAPTPPSA